MKEQEEEVRCFCADFLVLPDAGQLMSHGHVVLLYHFPSYINSNNNNQIEAATDSMCINTFFSKSSANVTNYKFLL